MKNFLQILKDCDANIGNVNSVLMSSSSKSNVFSGSEIFERYSPISEEEYNKSKEIMEENNGTSSFEFFSEAKLMLEQDKIMAKEAKSKDADMNQTLLKFN